MHGKTETIFRKLRKEKHTAQYFHILTHSTKYTKLAAPGN